MSAVARRNKKPAHLAMLAMPKWLALNSSVGIALAQQLVSPNAKLDRIQEPVIAGGSISTAIKADRIMSTQCR